MRQLNEADSNEQQRKEEKDSDTRHYYRKPGQSHWDRKNLVYYPTFAPEGALTAAPISQSPKAMATSDEKESSGTEIPLVMRLRCWYHDELGENQGRNHSLAARFREKSLNGWIVNPATPTAGNVQVNDKFVPISVDFHHDSLLFTHDQAVKYTEYLWESYIKSTVREFFAELHRVLIGFSFYPQDENLPPDIRAQFCQYKWDKYKRESSIKPGTARIKNAGEAPSTWRYWELVLRTGYLVWCLWPATSDDAALSQSRNTGEQSEPFRPGVVKKQKRLKLNFEKPRVSIESFQELWKYAKDLANEHHLHQSELTRDVTNNDQRFLDTFAKFNDEFRNIISQLVLADSSSPKTSGSQSRDIRNMNAQTLGKLATETKKIMKTFSILHDNSICVTDAVREKHESWIRPSRWIRGGAIVVCCAGLCLSPALPMCAWVAATSGGTKAVAVVGAGGGCSVVYGGYRNWKESNASDLRKDVNDTCNDVKKQLEKLFATIVVCYCEAVLRRPFKELNEGDQDTLLNDFGVDSKNLDKIDYIEGKLSQAKEHLEVSKQGFVTALGKFRKEEQFSEMTD